MPSALAYFLESAQAVNSKQGGDENREVMEPPGMASAFLGKCAFIAIIIAITILEFFCL